MPIKIDRYEQKEMINPLEDKEIKKYMEEWLLDWVFETTVINLVRTKDKDFFPDLWSRAYTKESLKEAFDLIVKWYFTGEIKLIKVGKINKEENRFAYVFAEQVFPYLYKYPEIKNEVFEKYVYSIISKVELTSYEEDVSAGREDYEAMTTMVEAPRYIVEKLLDILKKWENKQVLEEVRTYVKKQREKALEWLEKFRKEYNRK